MKTNSILLFGVFVGCLCVALVGCSKSPAPAKVTGTVTLDGKPVVGAEIIFKPQDGSRSSVGATDSEGKYKLRFSASLEGAAVGTHNVTISTGEVEESGEAGAPVETVPAKYNKKSVLQETLKSGRNTVDFKLTSK